MKSLEVTLFLNQTPADGVASVVSRTFIFCLALPVSIQRRVSRCVVKDSKIAWLMPVPYPTARVALF
jgi:hypothetical protein